MSANAVSVDELKILDDLTVVIQAGGESKRMGRSKATVPFLGTPLIWRGVRRLSPITDELIITTNEPENLKFLAEEYGRGDIRLVTDELKARGALNGLYTALKNATKDYVAVVACDMIFASAPLLTYEHDLLVESGADAAIPYTSHGYEPFHSVYRRNTCLAFVTAAIEAGERRANSWFDKGNLRLLDSDEILKADPRGGAFVNVNTPDELHAMEQRILEEGISFASDDREK